MKNKILFIVLGILIIILCILLFFRNKESNSNEENLNTSSKTTNTVSVVNTHGENTGIYVGIDNKDGHDNFLLVSIKIDKSTSKEEQVKSLISSISNTTGYQIDINSIEIDGDSIKIDLAKTSAPFELEESYKYSETQQYFFFQDYTIEKTILDSINKTIKNYFGSNTKLYLSADSEDISIDNGTMQINIDSTKDYDEQ